MTKNSIYKLFVSAKRYSERFVDKNYAFLYKVGGESLRCMETVFPASAFMHLTGLKPNMRSDEFFDACLSRKLPAVILSGKKDLAEVKLSVLPQLLDTAHYRMIGDFIPSGIFIETEKLTGNK